MFPFILKALVEGSVLVMDEFDANIHPMALMNIINIFMMMISIRKMHN